MPVKKLLVQKEQLLQFIFNIFSKEEKFKLYNKLKEEFEGGV